MMTDNMLHGPTLLLVYEWARSRKYRVVKFDLPNDELPWRLVRTRGIWPFTWLESVNGYDRGASGPYNHQALTAGNPISTIEQLFEVAVHHTRNKKMKWNGRDPVPRAPILEEINIRATIKVMMRAKPTGNLAHDLRELNLKAVPLTIINR